MLIRVLTVALLLLPLSVRAAETTLHKKALVAGYKAGFICSAIFNAGKTIDQIAGQELARIYPDYREILETLPKAVIDQERKTVRVRFAESMPPRISAWRPHLGCARLPVGARMGAARALARVDMETPEPDARRWPFGDKTRDRDLAPGLQPVIDAAFDAETYGEGTLTSVVLVTRADRMLGEGYRDGFSIATSQRTWSVAKSIAASIIGIAVKEGLLDVKAPAPVPEWQRPGDPRATITLENLLNMASGLYWPGQGSRTPDTYMGGSLVTETAAVTPLEVPPGTRFRYANNDTLLAVRALRAAIGDDDAYRRYPFEKLLHRIGMTNTVLETDWDGNFILSSQVWSTARDLARLGILYLNDGMYRGERILPEGWRDYVSSPALVQPAGEELGYGAQFWLYRDIHPDLPSDAFAALGHRGQSIMIIPSRDLVIVRRGYDASGGTGFNAGQFAVDVLRALDRK